jgi:hypothetical protein
MQIRVTWIDIVAGKSMRASECMVALAIKRELGTEYVSVSLGDVRIKLDRGYVTLRLPANVGQKIRIWELFHFAFPFAFEFPGLGFSAVLAESVSPAKIRSEQQERSRRSYLPQLSLVEYR